MQLDHALQQLVEIVSAPVLDFDDLNLRILELGTRFLGTEEGFLSEIRGGRYVVRAVLGEGDLGWRAEVDLKDTLCSAVVVQKTVLAFGDVPPEAGRHPGAPGMDYKRYIGAPLLHAGAVIGTVSFASRTKQPAFPDGAESFMRHVAGFLRNARLVQGKIDTARQERDNLRFVLDEVPSRIWLKDDRNIILFANRSAAQSMDVHDPEQLAGADTYKLFPEIAAKYHEDDLEVIRSGMPRLGIVEPYLPREGERGWVSTDKIPLTDPNGRRGVIVIATDIAPPGSEEA